MQEFGPIYCELQNTGIIGEPVNTVTNIAAFIAAFAAWYFLRRASVKSWETTVLIFLLIATGMGSAFWHATRWPLALTFDFLPGALLFIFFLFLWVRELRNRWFGYGAVALLFLLQWFSIAFLPSPTELLFWLKVHGITAAFGLALVLYTYRLRGIRIALWGLSAVFLYAIAAAFRSIDLAVCADFPIGTHFLWHIFLSAAAFAGIGLIAILKKERRSRAVS